jgi:putative phosphoribosyl transferase
LSQRIFRDRREAGVGQELAAVANLPDVIVLALPRGGVPVGFEWLARSVRPLTCF